MTAAPHTQCQPDNAAAYKNVCPEVDCIYHGKPSSPGCGCHRTREHMMLARIAELTQELDNNQSLLAMVLHVGPDSAAWKIEGISDLMTKQIVENRLTLSMPLEQSGSGK